MKTRTRSKKIFQRLTQCIPGGVNSPIRAFRKMEQLPMIAASGAGAIVYDIDENPYIDYCGSWGPLIHGHAHPQIIEKVQERMLLGTSFGIATEIELLIAEEIKKLVPSIETLRFVNSGTEATMTALRVARGYTNRPFIVKFSGHYHGHADHLLISAGSGLAELNQTSSSLGVPDAMVQHTLVLPFNDTAAITELFEKRGHEIAAVILEPVAANMGVVPPRSEYLQLLRELTTHYQALLIFDEVITGFRLGLQGAQGYFGMEADLVCYGKIVGGGFPAAAFGGRKEVMEVLAPLGGVYQAGTLSGNPIAMEAGLQTLKLLQAPHFYENLKAKTDRLTDPIRRYLEKSSYPMSLQQEGSLFSIFFGTKEVDSFEALLKTDGEKFKQLFQWLFERGIYPPPLHCEAWFVSNAHTEAHLDQTSELIVNGLEQLGL